MFSNRPHGASGTGETFERYTFGIRVAPEPSGDLRLIARALAVFACARRRS
jgi:hypothetical protein